MSSGRVSRRSVLSGMMALGSAVPFARKAHAAPLELRVGWATMPGHLIPVLFDNPEQKGLKHYGKSYTVEPILFRGSSPQLTALASGDLDFFASAPSTLALGVTNAHLDLQVVADIIQDAHDHHSDTWLVAGNGPIHRIEDLKGKRLATNAIGSAADTAMRALLLQHGLADRRDYVVIQAAFSAMPSLLEKGEVDCAPILNPFYQIMMKTGKYRGLFNARDVFGSWQAVFLAARSSFMDKHKDVVADFMEDWVRSRRWFLAESNRKTAVDIVARFMHLPNSDLDYLFTDQDYYRDPWSVPDVVGIQKPIDMAHQIGVLKETIEVASKHADLAFVEEAKKRITQAS